MDRVVTKVSLSYHLWHLCSLLWLFQNYVGGSIHLASLTLPFLIWELTGVEEVIMSKKKIKNSNYNRNL